jgi:hypothetical protein
MKRNFKRTLSLILAVLMVVAVVPFSGMAAVCTHPNAVVVKSNTEIKHTVICPDCTLNETSDCASSNTEVATCQNPHYCDVCNRELSATHNFTIQVEAPQTLKEDVICTEFKVYYKSCNCGKISETVTFTSTTNKGTIHDFTARIMEPEYVAKEKCGEDLYYYFACSRCKVSAEDFELPEGQANTYADEETTVQHKFEIPTTPSESAFKSKATCTSPALFYMECVRDGCDAIDKTKTYTIGEKLDHEYIDNFADGKADEKYLINPATCSLAAMYSMYCKHCGDKAVKGSFNDNNNVITTVDIKNEKGEVVHKQNAFYFGDALNHGKLKVTVKEKAPTCTTDGNTEELTCEYCNTVMVGSEKRPKLGHKLDSTLLQEYKAPTCVTNGQLGKVKCVREGCGAILEVNAKGEYETTKDNLASFDVTKKDHVDENKDLICDRPECLSVLDPSDTCPCLCHGEGFMYFIGWILKWIWSLTGTNPYCQCGEAHYAVD